MPSPLEGGGRKRNRRGRFLARAAARRVCKHATGAPGEGEEENSELRIGVIGVGEMGSAIGGHLRRKSNEVVAFDTNSTGLNAIDEQGIARAYSLEAHAGQ